MLSRPPNSRRRQRHEKRERRRLAQIQYRRRIDAGRITVTVEIDGDVIEMLVASRWLIDGECHDRKKIGMALSAMVAEAAKR
jgi:hypothetical protein